MGKIILCADVESLAYPALLGLEDVDLGKLPWLVPFSDAMEAREFIRESNLADEVWVAECGNMGAINLGAAVAKDNGELPVYVLDFGASGSTLSRSQAAGIKGVLGKQEFMQRFAGEKEARTAKPQVQPEAIPEIRPEVQPEIQPETQPETQHETQQLPSFQEQKTGKIDVQPKHMRPVSSKPVDTNTFLITVLSGSGGAGKSTISALIACMCAMRGLKTLLLDCDLQFGDLHRFMGAQAVLTADDALSDLDTIKQLANAVPAGVPALIAAPMRLERAEIVAQYVPNLLDEASKYFDVIVTNTGASWAECHASLLERSTFPLFLIDQRASSVRACQHAVDLCMRMGIATGNFAYAVNRCERGALFTPLDVACVMHGAQVFELKEGGHEIEELMGSGLATHLAASKNDLCESVNAMLSEVLPLKDGVLNIDAMRMPGAGAGAIGIAGLPGMSGMPGGLQQPYEKSGRAGHAARRKKGRHKSKSLNKEKQPRSNKPSKVASRISGVL